MRHSTHTRSRTQCRDSLHRGQGHTKNCHQPGSPLPLPPQQEPMKEKNQEDIGDLCCFQTPNHSNAYTQWTGEKARMCMKVMAVRI